jgi:sugar-specific transcriptional regulator TrmB
MRVERFNRHWVTLEENQRLQQRISELETENEKLKNRNDIIRELISLISTSNWFRPSGTGIRQENGNSLEQVIELAKDLSNDIRNIMKVFSKNMNDNG